jgi:hypothetical protein
MSGAKTDAHNDQTGQDMSETQLVMTDAVWLPYVWSTQN